jgi:carotenoid 1,2-hydratase
MRLILDPAEDAAHGAWLRTAAGAYEWWYFDALSDDGRWALTCIWFLGNPFSPYYRLTSLGRTADPFAHNALFFALYRDGQLYAYHFTRFDASMVCADETRPATLRFGPNDLSSVPGRYHLRLADVNGNGRRLDAELIFNAPPLVAESIVGQSEGDGHCWLPAAPACRVRGEIALSEVQNTVGERIRFTGQGYHDHNWGALPFSAQIRDWYWARVALGEQDALIVYHVEYHHGPPVSHLLCFEEGRLVLHDASANVTLGRRRRNAFGTGYATQINVRSGDLSATVRLGARLDSAPFYIRTLCDADVTQGGRTRRGRGVGEYFRPRMLSWALTASATRARIVMR